MHNLSNICNPLDSTAPERSTVIPETTGTRPPGGTVRPDRRSARSCEQLRDALAAEIVATGDLTQVTVTGLTDRAGLTRRTFYSHYRDIGHLVSSIEDATAEEFRVLLEKVLGTRLDELFSSMADLDPTPGAVELLTYFKDRGHYLVPLMGPGGDPAFIQRLKDDAHDLVSRRALQGIDVRALGAFFDYYITFAIGAEFGVLERWLQGGMEESVDSMAHLMTLLMFVRPGDLYGESRDINIPAYGLALMENLEESRHDH